MTKQEFLDRAHAIHGYKYEYLNLKDKILSNESIDILYNSILYKQKVVKHILLGRCPEKNTPLKTTEEFIKEAKNKWGDKYDYSLTNYTGALKKIKIKYDGIIFEQIANSHLNYAPELNMNQEYFIHKAKNKWGNIYDYSLVEYKNCKEKVKIIFTKTNVVFEQSPHSHSRSHSLSHRHSHSLSLTRPSSKKYYTAVLVPADGLMFAGAVGSEVQIFANWRPQGQVA